MPASYPGAVKTFTTKSAPQTIEASHVNDLQDEVTAIEDGLRNATAPLNSSNSTVVSLSVSGLSLLGGAIVASGFAAPTLDDGDTDDLAVASTVSMLMMAGNSSVSTLTGIASAAGVRRVLFISNAGAANIGLKNNSGSASTNRFLLPGNADMTLNPGDGAVFVYDPAAGFWRAMLA